MLDISWFGNEMVFYYSTETAHVWLARSSNAFVRVITWDKKDFGGAIAEKIIRKVRK